jgi:hypothetical protein
MRAWRCISCLLTPQRPQEIHFWLTIASLGLAQARLKRPGRLRFCVQAAREILKPTVGLRFLAPGPALDRRQIAIPNAESALRIRRDTAPMPVCEILNRLCR